MGPDAPKLAWYEVHTDAMEAVARDKRLEHWKRVWKIELIQDMKPHWDDLSADIIK